MNFLTAFLLFLKLANALNEDEPFFTEKVVIEGDPVTFVCSTRQFEFPYVNLECTEDIAILKLDEKSGNFVELMLYSNHKMNNKLINVDFGWDIKMTGLPGNYENSFCHRTRTLDANITVQMAKVRLNDSGLYQCKWSYFNGHFETFNSKLIVEKAQNTRESFLTKSVVCEGDPVSFVCGTRHFESTSVNLQCTKDIGIFKFDEKLGEFVKLMQYFNQKDENKIIVVNYDWDIKMTGMPGHFDPSICQRRGTLNAKITVNIAKVRLQDAGLYKCHWLYYNGHVETIDAKLTVEPHSPVAQCITANSTKEPLTTEREKKNTTIYKMDVITPGNENNAPKGFTGIGKKTSCKEDKVKEINEQTTAGLSSTTSGAANFVLELISTNVFISTLHLILLSQCLHYLMDLEQFQTHF